MVVRVQAAASAVGKWLGHMRGDGAVPFGDLRGGHLEEDDAVRGGQRVGVVEVDLELPVGVLVVALINPPAHVVERPSQLLQIGHGRRHGAEVVARLGQRVHAVRIPGPDRTVFIARDEKVLRLHAHVEDIALLRGIGEHPLKVGAGAIGMRLPIDEEVAGKAHGVRLPRQPRVRIEVNPRQHIVRVRPLSQAPNRRAGKTRAFVKRVVERRHRHHLHFGRAGHIDELDE